MGTSDPLLELLALAFVGLLVWYALLPLWAYNRLKSIEHALWAIVSKLDHLRSSEPRGAMPEFLREQPSGEVKTEVRGGVQRISNSAFGR